MSNGCGYPSSWLNVEVDQLAIWKNELEMSEAIVGRSVEEAGLADCNVQQGCAHYRTYWAELGRACSPEQGVFGLLLPQQQRRTRWWKVEKQVV